MLNFGPLGPAFGFALLFFLQMLNLSSGKVKGDFGLRQSALLLSAYGAGLFASLFESDGAPYKVSGVLWLLASGFFVTWIIKWLRSQKEVSNSSTARKKQTPQ